ELARLRTLSQLPRCPTVHVARPTRSIPRFTRNDKPAKIDVVKAKIFLAAALAVTSMTVHAQPTPGPRGVDKTLITSANQDHVMGAAALHTLANDYYNWR